MLFAVAIRLVWIDFDLPLAPDVDAGKFVGEANRMVSTGDYRPQDFQYPGGYTYLLALTDCIGGLKTAYAENLCARLWSMSLDLGTIVLTGLMAWRLAGPCAAIIALGWLACSTLNIALCRTAGPDTMLAFWMTAAFWRLIQPRLKWGNILLAGTFVGLAVGTKFSGLYAAAWLPIVIWIAAGKQTGLGMSFVYVASGVAIGVAAFWITTPWFFSCWSEYAQRFHLEMIIQQSGQIGRVQLGYCDYLWSPTVTPEQPWLATSLAYELGPVSAVVLAVAVLAALALRGGWKVFGLAIYAVLFVALISGPGRVKFLRFLLPMMPVFAVLTGWFCQRYILLPLRRTTIACACILTICLAAFPAWKSLTYVASMRGPSSVSLWREWMSDHVLGGNKVFVSPFFLGDYSDLPFQFASLTRVGMRQYDVPADVGPSPERQPLYYADLVRQLRANLVSYVVLNSYFDDGLAATPENVRWFPKSVENYAAFRAALAQNGEMATKIDGFGSGRCGPTIEVWHLKTTSH